MKSYGKKHLVGETLWDIKFVKEVPKSKYKTKEPDERVVGLCCPDNNRVYLVNDLPKIETFKYYWHEICHTFEEEYGVEIGHDMIDILEKAIPNFLIDNWYYINAVIMEILKEKSRSKAEG